ncbi:MAG: hypothetical protein KF819_10150 [Labilithrix sp.]|nr:hypothetical protein [Labilithrix sp.]
MTDRCTDVTARRPRDYCADERASSPSKEDVEASRVANERAAEREAETRRNAYFSAGTDEGGRSRAASSDASVWAQSTKDDPGLREWSRTRRVDPPLQDDPLGNAIVAAAAGGVVAGARAASAQVGLDSAAKGLVKAAAKVVAKEMLESTKVELPAEQPAQPSTPPRAPASGAPGRSSPHGASELVRDPVRSEGPRIPEVLPRDVVMVKG